SLCAQRVCNPQPPEAPGNMPLGAQATGLCSGAELEPQFLFDLSHACEQFSQAADPGNLLLCFLDRSGRITEPNAARNIFGNAALRRDDAAIGDFNVADDAHLSRHRDALAYAGAP